MHKCLVRFVVVSLILSASALGVRYPIATVYGPNPGQITAIAAQNGILALSFDADDNTANQINLYTLGTWQPLAVLTIASDPNAFVESISITPDYIVAGAGDFSSQLGAAYIFQIPADGKWQDENETAVLSPSDSQAGDNFGVSVAAWGSTLVVGASSAGNFNQGKGYVFVEPTNGWVDATETAQLTTSGGGMSIGYSVGILGPVGEGGNQIALGAPGSGSPSPGAIFVYEEPVSGWSSMTETAELTDTSDGASTQLGYSVAFGKSTIVGAEPGDGRNGSVVVYENNQNWQTNSQPNVRITDPRVTEWESVGIRQDGSILVACCGTDYLKEGPDLAFLYRKSQGFQQKTELSSHGFGYDVGAVAITNGYAFQSSYYAVHEPSEVYVFDGE
jgi:hypothetical protein